MKNLLYITPRLDGSGGLPKMFSVKTKYLVEQLGYQITILTTNARSNSYFFDFSKATIRNQHIPGKGLFYFYNYLKIVKQQIKKQNPDIIVIVDNGLKGLLLPYFLKNKKNTLIFEQHGHRYYADFEENSSFLKKIKQKILNSFVDISIAKVDQLVVLTPESKLEWKTKKCIAIPNPVCFAPFYHNALTQKRAIAVGRQVYEKGFDLLLAIWKQVVADYPDWILDVYGEKDQELGLEKLAKELHLEKNVHFHAPVLSIFEKYKEASVFLMTSRHEGFGMALIEAMACGLPCIAFDCPTGPREIIENGKNGFLIPMFDQNEYAIKVKEILENKDLRLQKGNQALQSVERFKLDVVMQQWDDLYTSFKYKY